MVVKDCRFLENLFLCPVEKVKVIFEIYWVIIS